MTAPMAVRHRRRHQGAHPAVSSSGARAHQGGPREYYESGSEQLLPELANRRCPGACPQDPEGCFYQKHIDKAWSGEIDRVVIPESDGEGI